MTLSNDLLIATQQYAKDSIETSFLYCNIGEDSTASTPADTKLGSEILRVPVDSVDKSVTDTITVSAVIMPPQANGSTIREAGWNDTNYSLVDGCDAITGWTDSADMTTHLNTVTFWEGTGAIDLTKDAGAAALVTTYKTVTSRDFTDNNLGFILYIIDSAALAKLAATDALIVRYGSDDSNYYEWKYDNADLDTGKILINDLTSANADSTTGTPVLTTMDYFYIGLTADAAATVWSDGDFIMDAIQLYGGTQWDRNTVTAIGKTDDVMLYLDTSIKITVTQS